MHFCQLAISQCNTTVNVFPYNEGFENNNGNWFVSAASVNSDWAWGTPAKSVITGAANGSKCWITGGLTGNFYNNGEESYLQSPCFDIAALQNPVISFNIFWETETKYDGAGFQYSLDSGKTWANLGSNADEQACPSSNWFNDPDIRYLSTGAGWTGNIQQGSGSGKWVNAMHDLSVAKGSTNVIFRFSFGAGTVNNNYNGFAVDDIFIGEKPANTVDFAYTCQENNIVNFNGVVSGCPNGFLWNFGDSATGADNTSNTQNPSHTFSSPGIFTVQFTTDSITVAKQIVVLNVEIKATDVSCNGAANGYASAIATGGIGYSYSWNTTPEQTTATINNLAPGDYIVTVASSGACTVSQSVTIAQPSLIQPGIIVTNEICGDKEGAITSNTIGGIPPYKYLWSDNETTSSINNLLAGTYSLTITDVNKCVSDTGNILVKDSMTPIYLFLGNDTSFCPGQQLILNAGTFSDYLWQDNTTNQTYTVTKTGEYIVQVTDTAGCSATDSIQVTVDCSDIFFPTAFTPNNDGRNDLFGAAGNVASARNYSFNVYNRWGQLIFHSTNPYQKWDGRINGVATQSDTFTWYASYSINTNPMQLRKGTVVLIR